MSRTPLGVVFDCDGTLVNSLGYALESFNHALVAIGEAPRTVEEIKRFFGAGADRIFLGLLGGDREKARRAFDAYFDHQSSLAEKMAPFPGVVELLERLKGAGLPLAVVTGRHERDLGAILAPHRVKEYFVTLIADNHLPHSKPAPDGILLAAERMGLRPEQLIYVGDSPMDMKAARAAGAAPVAALWDELAHREQMVAEQPAFLAPTPLDVWGFVASRLAKSP